MSTYTEIYNKVIRSTTQLPPEISDFITVPEAIYAPPGYLTAPIRVMIAGSEAHGGGQPLLDAAIDTTASERQQWKEYFFQNEVVIKKYSTPFWRQYDWISEGLELQGRESIAYTNVCRVQRIAPKGKSYSLNSGPALYADNYGTTRVEVGAWQSPLVELEWKMLKPDIVIVSAINGHQWLSKTFPELERHDISIGKRRIERWDNLPCPTIGIQHPGNGREAPDDFKKEIIKLIKNLIQKA